MGTAVAKINDEEWKKIEAGLGVTNTGVGAEFRAFEQSFKKLAALAGSNPGRMGTNCKPESAPKAEKYCAECYKALDRATNKMFKIKVKDAKTPEAKAFALFKQETAKLKNSLRTAYVDIHDLIPKKTMFVGDFDGKGR